MEMKKISQFRISLIVVGLTVIFFIQRDCSKKDEPVKKIEVVIPKVEGKFDKPTKVIEGKSKKDSIKSNFYSLCCLLLSEKIFYLHLLI